MGTSLLLAAGPSTLDVKPLAGQPNLLALDEGHGFQKKENRDTMTAAVALFLERQLFGNGAAGGSP